MSQSCSSFFWCVLSSCFVPPMQHHFLRRQSTSWIPGSCVHAPTLNTASSIFFRSSSSCSILSESSLRGRSCLKPSCKIISFLPRELKTSSQYVSCWAKARFYPIFATHYFLKKVKIGELFPLPCHPSEAISLATGVPPALWGTLMTPLTVGHTFLSVLRAKVWALGLSLGPLCCLSPFECHPKLSCHADTWELILWGQLVRCPRSQGRRGHIVQGWDLKLLEFLHYCCSKHLSGSKKKARKAKNQDSALLW